MKIPAYCKAMSIIPVLTPKQFLQNTGLLRSFPRRTQSLVELSVGVVVEHDEVGFPGEVAEVEYVLRCNMFRVPTVHDHHSAAFVWVLASESRNTLHRVAEDNAKALRETPSDFANCWLCTFE